jgi:hypothetical protein
LVIGLSRQPCGATKTSAPNRASSRTGAERIPDKGVNGSYNPAYSRVQPDRTSWPLPNRELPMNESQRAPADHPAPHPKDSPACALFTFVQSADKAQPDETGPIPAGGVYPDPIGAGVATLTFLPNLRCPFCFKFLISIFKFPFSNY